MIVIPNLSLVVIQPPRTGSTSLRRALLESHPNCVSVYRHMERSGLPQDLKPMKIACIIRHPLDRLHSLWRYMRAQNPQDQGQWDPQWAKRVRDDANRPFEDWLEHSMDPFCSPSTDPDHPSYHALNDSNPIARKSLYAWARPDLGPVELLKLEDGSIARRLNLNLPHLNAAPKSPKPSSRAVQDFLDRHHSWDLNLYDMAMAA